MDAPREKVLHVTGWNARALHGPGRRWTIMALPGSWAQGDGRVEVLAPLGHLQRLMQDALDARRAGPAMPLFGGMPGAGHLTRSGAWRPGQPPDPEDAFRRYRGAYDAHLGLRREMLQPGLLVAATGRGPVQVALGDTLLCACAVGQECHRRWATEHLARAGWPVLLDGRRVGAP